jgi:hypothetical protein
MIRRVSRGTEIVRLYKAGHANEWKFTVSYPASARKLPQTHKIMAETVPTADDARRRGGGGGNRRNVSCGTDIMVRV